MRTIPTTQAPILFVISGPSGSGKGEALSILRDELSISQVVTWTSRPPRPQEINGVDYNFVSPEEFTALADDGRFLEFNRTYGAHAYGSPSTILSFVEDTPAQVMELDPEGFLFLKANSTRRIIGLFICPASIAQLDERIRSRAPVNDLENRLQTARRQIRLSHVYDFVFSNDSDLRIFKERLETIVESVLLDNKGRRLINQLTAEVSRSDLHGQA